MTRWNHVRTSEVQFSKVFIQHSNFHQWRVEQSNLTDCLFQAVNFHGTTFSDCRFQDVFFSQCHFSEVEFLSTHFENVVFDRCVFSKSLFSTPKNIRSLIDLEFRHCTFLDMETALKDVPNEKLIGTISGGRGKNEASSGKTTTIQNNLNKFF